MLKEEKELVYFAANLAIEAAIDRYGFSPVEKVELFAKGINAQLRKLGMFYDVVEKSDEEKGRAVDEAVDEIVGAFIRRTSSKPEGEPEGE